MGILNCNSCNASLFSIRKSICIRCIRSLKWAPPLCQKCGSHLCPSHQKCLFLTENHSFIKSYSAGYWLVGHGFRVLKSWKRNGGSFFDQMLIDPAICRIQHLPREIDGVIAIPQNLRRTLRLRRNPAEFVANQISKKLSIELIQPFLSLEKSNQRQAQNTLIERVQKLKKFQIELGVQVPKRILLVDDFMTSGRTLKKASETLSYFGAREIHVYCLGVRPRFIKRTDQSLDLKHA